MSLSVRMMPIGKIKPYAGNPRVNDAAVAAVAASIREFGWRQPIVVDKAGVIVAGHTRYKAAIELGLAKVPVHAAKDLTKAQIKAYRLADNQTNNLSDWDFGKLKVELGELGDMKFDLGLLGFGDELAGLMGVEPAEGNTDDDAVPEPPKKAITKPGDLYILGHHRVLCGDSTKPEDVARLMAGEKAGAVFTDPPYGINQPGVPGDEAENHAALIGGAVPLLPIVDAAVVAFQSTRTFPVWLDAIRGAGHCFERMLTLYKEAQCTFPWRGWILISESICISSVGKPDWQDVKPYHHDVYSVSEVSHELPDHLGWHGSVKPMAVVVDILQRILRLDGLLFDGFLGSGTTLIAAEKLGRRCYGIEIEPRYVDVIVRRWEEFTGGKAKRKRKAGGRQPSAISSQLSAREEKRGRGRKGR